MFHSISMKIMPYVYAILYKSYISRPADITLIYNHVYIFKLVYRVCRDIPSISTAYDIHKYDNIA